MANHLAMAATVEPGDEVLVEHPTYELLVSTLQYLGASVRYFERRMEDGFRLDPAEVERQITSRTRLIVITNLHNPSGALADEETLRAVGDIAKRHHALVLVDEVYLEAMFDRRPRPALHLGEHFLVTSSLTKAYGLSGLRCGWVLAAPELAQRMWHIHDLYGVNAAHPAELLSVIALDNLERVSARAKSFWTRTGGHWIRFWHRVAISNTAARSSAPSSFRNSPAAVWRNFFAWRRRSTRLGSCRAAISICHNISGWELVATSR